MVQAAEVFAGGTRNIGPDEVLTAAALKTGHIRFGQFRAPFCSSVHSFRK
jgi:hypothetical protein